MSSLDVAMANYRAARIAALESGKAVTAAEDAMEVAEDAMEVARDNAAVAYDQQQAARDELLRLIDAGAM